MRWISLLCAFLLVACDSGNHPRFQGYVEGDYTYLASPYGGALVKLHVVRGQKVTKNQLLFELDPNPQMIAAAEANYAFEAEKHTLKDFENPRRFPEILAIKAEIGRVEADIKLAKARLERYQKLYDQKVVDKDTFDEAISNLARQEQLKVQYLANLSLAEMGNREEQIKSQGEKVKDTFQKYQDTKWQLEQKTKRAPSSGVIIDTYYRIGEYVGAEKPVVSLLSPENVHVEFFVVIAFLPRIQLGQKVTVRCDTCRNSEEAVISYISPEAQYVPPLVYSFENRDKLVFRIQADLSDNTELKPGEPVMVRL